VRSAVEQAQRSDAAAGLPARPDSLASAADCHGPALARPPLGGADERLAWLRERGLLVIEKHGMASRPAGYLLTIPRHRRADGPPAGA
jgi:hypothetical protein